MLHIIFKNAILAIRTKQIVTLLQLKNLKPSLIYGLFFICIFNFGFAHVINDGVETRNMFVVISFILVFLTAGLFVLYRYFFKGKTNLFADAVVLFLISEFVTAIITGQVSFFGLFYTNEFTDPKLKDLDTFRKDRNFALSMSFLIAAMLFVMQTLVFKNRTKSEQ